MTTVVAYRTAKGVVMGSDSQITRGNSEICGFRKFIKIDNGFFGVAGCGRIGFIAMEYLQHTINSFVYSGPYINRETLSKLINENFMAIRGRVFEDITRKLNVGEKVPDILLSPFSFIYIDNVKMVHGMFNLNNGLTFLDITYNEDLKNYTDYWAGMGSGEEYACQYLRKHRYNNSVTAKEAVRRAVCSARSRDIYSGGEILVERILCDQDFNVCPLIDYSVYRKAINLKTNMINVRRHLGYSLKFAKELLSKVLIRIFYGGFTKAIIITKYYYSVLAQLSLPLIFPSAELLCRNNVVRVPS